jgi:hypothetical protein
MNKWIFAASALLAVSLQAQTLSGLKIEPALPKVGEAVKITLEFSNIETPNCGMRIAFGDGDGTEAKINQTKDVPNYVLSRTYAKPGSYTVIAEPKRSGSSLKCAGKNISKVVTVAALPVPVPAPAPTPTVAVVVPAAPTPAASAPVAKAEVAKPASLCPEGWTLVKPGQNAKTKAFTCTAKAGTKIPEPKLSCPGDLTYFDNSKKGQMGCRV